MNLCHNISDLHLTRPSFIHFTGSMSLSRPFAVSLRRTLTSAKHAPKCPPLDEALHAIIVCPLTKEPLIYDPVRNYLVSEAINVSYSFTPTGLPNLLPQEATILQQESKNTQSE
jgi:uncharacterized protein YbaR (Trm112 family)